MTRSDSEVPAVTTANTHDVDTQCDSVDGCFKLRLKSCPCTVAVRSLNIALPEPVSSKSGTTGVTKNEALLGVPREIMRSW